jgi:hypothetical protein
MMSYFRFLLLTTAEKQQCLNKVGSLLLERSTDRGKFCLYALNNFFVEVHTDEQNRYPEILAFKSADRLAKYADCIELADLDLQG